MRTLMPLVDQLFQASCQIDIRGDPDSEEYVMSLWEQTASFYSSVTQCFKNNAIGLLAPYLANILNFALHAAAHSSEFDETQMAALMVIGDMASVLRHAPDPQLRQQAKSALLTPSVNNLLQQAMQSSSSDDNTKQMQWICKQLSNLERS
jgi:importin subunit beta-1